MASIPVDSVPRENRFGAIRFKQPTDSCLIRFLIIVVFRFLKILGRFNPIRFQTIRFFPIPDRFGSLCAAV